MFKKLIVIVLVIGWVVPSFAQLDPYNYRIGVGIGYTNYYGDLSPYRVDGIRNLSRHFDYNPYYIPEASYAVSFEKRLSSSISLMLSAGQYHMSMSDRFLDRDGNLQTQLPNFNRSLNFQTKLKDAGLGLVFRTDNDRILNKTAFMAPYFTLGVGIFQFDVKGDLLDDAGLPYDYSNDMVVPNRKYETNLRPLHTELDEGYLNRGYYYGLGLGIRFRIAKQVELFVQSDFKRSSSDYLDDVSGVYRDSYTNEFQAYAAMPGTNEVNAEKRWRGDENGRFDWYMYHHAGLKISIAPSKKAFRASRISPGTTVAASRASAQREEDSLRNVADTLATPIHLPTNQYFNFFQINPPSTDNKQLSWRVSKAEETIGLFEDQQLEDLNNRTAEGIYSKIDSLNELATAWANLEEPTEQDLENINSLNQYRGILSEKVDSLRFQRMLLNDRIILRKHRLDSLNQVRFEEPIGLDPGFDSLLFNQGFRELYRQLNKALIQDDNWKQLSRSLDQADRQNQEETFQDPLFEQRNFSYSNTADQRQRYYQDQPYQPANRSYNYFPPDQSAQNSYVPVYPYSENRNSRSPREYRPSRSTTIYQPLSREFRDNRQNKRSNNLVPIFIPGGGGKTNSVVEETPATDSLQGQTNVNALTQGDSRPIDSVQQTPLTDSLWRNKVDTLFLDKEIIVGLPNSKKEVYFGINKETLEDEEKQKLQAVVAILDIQPAFYITLAGFADNTGDISYNLTLVGKRVNHVKSLLINEFGVDEKRISVKPGSLLIRDRNRGSRNEDRKVEIIIYDPASVK